MSKLEIKKDLLTQIANDYNESEAIIISDYSGISATDIVELRQQIFKQGFRAKVIKNRMIKRWFETQQYDVPDNILKGQNIFLKTDNNVVGLSKLLVDFTKENESFQIKGGILNGDYIDEKQIKHLSKLPSKEDLIAKTVGLIKSPLTGLVLTLSSPLNAFINVLNNIKNNKQEVK